MTFYCITHLDDNSHYCCSRAFDVYDHLLHFTGDYYMSEEISSWALFASVGDNWTCEELGVDVSIMDD